MLAGSGRSQLEIHAGFVVALGNPLAGVVMAEGTFLPERGQVAPVGAEPQCRLAEACNPGYIIGAPPCGAAMARGAFRLKSGRAVAAAAGAGPPCVSWGAGGPAADTEAPSSTGDVAGVAYRLERCGAAATAVGRGFETD